MEFRSPVMILQPVAATSTAPDVGGKSIYDLFVKRNKYSKKGEFAGDFSGDITNTWGFIRTRLLVTRSDYCYRVWHEFSRYLIEEFGQRPPTYASFAKYWWILKQLGFIEPIGPPRTGKGGKPRQFYRIVPGKEPEDLWPGNPQYELYGEPVRLGRRRYRRRILKLPPKKPGRPKGESLS